MSENEGIPPPVESVQPIENEQTGEQQTELTEAQEDKTKIIEENRQGSAEETQKELEGDQQKSDERSTKDESFIEKPKSEVGSEADETLEKNANERVEQDELIQKELEDEGKHVSEEVLTKKISEDLAGPLKPLPTTPGKRIGSPAKSSVQSSKSEIMDGEGLEEGLNLESDEDTTIYLESIYGKRPEIDYSLQTVIPPKSWPSEAELSQDSDAYPQESEYKVSVDSDTVLQPTKTDKKLFREFSRLKIGSMPSLGSDEPEPMMHSSSIDKVSPVQVETERISEVKEEVVSEEPEIETEMSEAAFTFLRNVLVLPLGQDALEEISFSETLLISYDLHGEEQETEECECVPVAVPHKSQLFEPRDVQEMGGMCLSIETAACKLITFCTTQFSCFGTAGASRLLSVVDNNFALIDEKKTEWHCTHDKKIEKSLHVAQEKSGFVAFRTEAEDEEVLRHRGEINLKGDLLLDGGLFALMRYLVITNFIGEFETWSMHIAGDICRCKFTVGKKKMLYINGVPYMTIRIKKELFRLKRYPDISKTYFLTSGHMVRHRWKGCRYFIHINPFGNIPPVPSKTCLENQWRDDIILVSKYLDEKQKRRSEIQTYVGDNPEIKSILQDYMLCLLQLKPENILDFTIEYFTNLFRE